MARSKSTADTPNEEYNADSIITLDARSHLIKRMGLTFGPEGIDPNYQYSQQKTVAVREIIDNATDEIRAGHGSKVKLSIFKDGSVEVQDSGRGIPTDVNHSTHESGIYMSLGKTQSGGKFSTDSDRFSSGLNGVGGGSVALISKAMFVNVYRGGKKYQLDFSNGVPGYFAAQNDPDSEFTSLKDMHKDNSYLKVSKDDRPSSVKKDYKTGTTIRFWLDDSAFTSSKPIDDVDLVNRFKWTAFLVPTLVAEVYDECTLVENEPLEQVFNYPDGVKSMIDYLAPNDHLIPIQHIKTEGHYSEEVAVITGKKNDDGGDVVVKKTVDRRIPIEVAWTYSTDPSKDRDYRMNSFVNTIHTKLGGVHVKAFERALVKVFDDNFRPGQGLKKSDEAPKIDDFTEGMTVVLSIEQSEPGFSSQSKEELSGSENQKAIQNALEESFTDWVTDRKNKDSFDKMARKVIAASQVRLNAEAEKQLKRKANKIESASMPAKLDDCEFIGEDGSELFICEGDSAKGGLVSSRDARFQAVLPIRGKIINAYKAKPNKLMENAEVQGIIKALGAGWGKSFDVDKMRYSRILIATDADDDGFDIQNLLLILFWKIFKPVIEEGRFYITVPPLFEIAFKKADQPAITVKDQADLNDKLKKLNNRGLTERKDFEVHRNKGLGENDNKSGVTWTTMMDPTSRVLKRITSKDVEGAEAALELTLGSDVPPRRKWIEESSNSIDEEELDV
jgi:DNA gyrase subunit B